MVNLVQEVTRAKTLKEEVYFDKPRYGLIDIMRVERPVLVKREGLKLPAIASEILPIELSTEVKYVGSAHRWCARGSCLTVSVPADRVILLKASQGIGTYWNQQGFEYHSFERIASDIRIANKIYSEMTEDGLAIAYDLYEYLESEDCFQFSAYVRQSSWDYYVEVFPEYISDKAVAALSPNRTRN